MCGAAGFETAARGVGVTSDPLSVAAIGVRQQQVEQEVQGVPQMQKELDEAVLQAELTYKRAEAKALSRLPATEGRRLTVGERDAVVFEKCAREWEVWQMAKIQADYARSVGKALFAELSSLQSRLRVAFESDRAHGRFGAG